MVDCRPAAGAAPHDLAHTASNGAPPDTHHNQQAPGNNEMSGHGITSPASVRASTPATSNTLTTYTAGGMTAPTGAVYSGAGAAAGPGGCGPYVCGVKSVVWCAGASPPPHAQPAAPPLPPGPPVPPIPPHGVNPHVYKSVQANGADLPMNDIPTLRYYFNLGVECMWAAYGPPPPHMPPRHYSPRDLAQDMQQMALHDRPMNHNSGGGEQNHKHKPPGDKPPLNNQGKGNGQRPLLGPRFKRGGNNQDNNQNQNNHNQNKGHNNNMGNKGPNNRRNSHAEGGRAPHAYAEPDCLEQPLLTLPYIPYPPPLYPIPYYPVESDPAMMGMMGGMGYVGYDEGVEYGAPLQYYPHPPPHYPHPPHLPHPHPHPQPHPQQHPQPQPPHHNHHPHHPEHK